MKMQDLLIKYKNIKYKNIKYKNCYKPKNIK